MNKLHKTYAVVVLAVLAFVSLSGVYAYGLYTVFAQSREIASLSADVRGLALAEAHLESMEEVLEETKVERAKLAAVFLTGAAVVGFIEEVEALARASGVSFEIESIDSVSIEGDEHYSWLSLSLSTLGSWGESYRFFAQLERLPYVLLVDTARLELSRDVEQPGWSGLVVISVAVINELP